MLRTIKDHLLLVFIIIAIFAGVIIAKTMPLEIVRGSYTLSLLIKDIIMFFLPFVIFSCISYSLVQEHKVSAKIFIIVILLICLSNFTSTIIAFILGKTLVTVASASPEYSFTQTHLEAFKIPKIIGLIGSEKGLFAGIAVGFIASFFHISWAINAIKKSYGFSLLFLNKFFTPFVPLFIMGFIAKSSYEGMLGQLISNNIISIIFILGSVWLYLLFVLYVASYARGFSKKHIIRNISVPVISAFSSMSSAATLPLSIKAAEKNVKHKGFAAMYIPTSVNIHLIGDSIIVPMLAIVLMHHLQGYTPSITEYLVFSAYFIMAKFAIATVPGGGIFIMLPVLEKVFNFSPEMGGIITTFYLLLDPMLAATNVAGNNLFCIILDKLLFKKPEHSQKENNAKTMDIIDARKN
jgi:Na+/H+-dicarboxylate symporter